MKFTLFLLVLNGILFSANLAAGQTLNLADLKTLQTESTPVRKSILEKKGYVAGKTLPFAYYKNGANPRRVSLYSENIVFGYASEKEVVDLMTTAKSHGYSFSNEKIDGGNNTVYVYSDKSHQINFSPQAKTIMISNHVVSPTGGN